jgi:hypothetical protein
MPDRTPGPWATRFLFRMIRRVRESPGDLRIASPPENDWGDACLMAASPDLLAALKDMMEVQDSTDDCWCEELSSKEKSHKCEACRARAAIARAEGRTDV